MTNQELGDLLGCSFSMASRLRAGKRLPGPAVLTRIHEQFGVPYSDLMTARHAGGAAFGSLLRQAIEDRLAVVAA